ncbi:hypothetical protein FIU97_04915 [Roseivivax sp. THAF40]|uniref:DUF4168 domain-containing protein n=1 Tax=unclassified Roseivivax TaxID=2639302 RepID=UPI0012694475|nr:MULTISPECIES: DUF4168 domain-containing protein [unclassified Roseivivax]QFS82113.1 hypothetical protein FIV09_04655 [Roseivivax sp. THAF197b]QFT45913.1 hypothetical protein FIU97_04915 [Roseivivax sp. THAF40]
MRFAYLIAACALWTSVTSASAQEVQPEQAAFRAGYSAAQIDTFAIVAKRVAAMREETMNRYFEMENAEARRALIADANARMREIVIEADGLTLAEFERINAEARTDRALNRHIARTLKALDRES